MVSINVLTAMHSNLTYSFKVGTVVHGVLTDECSCTPFSEYVLGQFLCCLQK